MKLVRFDNAEEFYRRVEPFLVAREAAHGLPLGILSGLRRSPERTPDPYMALVEKQGQIVGIALRTPPYNLVLSLQDDPAAPTLIARELHAAGMALPGVVGPAELSLAFAKAWLALSGQAQRPGMSLRLYELRHVVPPAGVAGTMWRATTADRELLVDWLLAFHAEALDHHDRSEMERMVDGWLGSGDSGMALWLNPDPVSMAGFSGPTPHGIRIVAVYTPPELRGRGYARALVAQLSQQLLDEGRSFCCLFTNLANPTANKIYQQIGYQPVCDFAEYKFEEPGAGS